MHSEPWSEALESALRIVESDVRATGLDGTVSLIPNDWNPEEYAYAVYQGTGSGSTVGIESSEADDPIDALVAVADDLQNSIMHVFWGTVWPVCPAHNLGAHARKHAGAAVWWCNDSDGHVIAAIGRWDGAVNRRRKRPPHH
jgi:hypothetical protein